MNSKIKIFFGIFAFFALLSTIYAEPLTSDLELALITEENKDNYSFNVILEIEKELTKAEITYTITDYSGKEIITKEDSLETYKPGCDDKICKITIDNLDLSDIEDGPVLFSVSIIDETNKYFLEKYTAKGFSINVTGETITDPSFEDYVIYGLINTPNINLRDLDSDTYNLEINIAGVDDKHVTCKVDNQCPLRTSIPANETPENSPDADIERNFCCYVSNSVDVIDESIHDVTVNFSISLIDIISASINLENEIFNFTFDRTSPVVDLNLSVTETAAKLTGTVIDNLSGIDSFVITVNGRDYDLTTEIDEEGNWNILLDGLPVDNYNISYVARDKVGNETNDAYSILNLQLQPENVFINRNNYAVYGSIGYSDFTKLNFDESIIFNDLENIKLTSKISGEVVDVNYNCNWVKEYTDLESIKSLSFQCYLKDLDDGNYTIDVTYDLSSIILKDTLNLVVDTTPPIITIDFPDPSTNTSPTLRGTIKEANLKTFYIIVDGTPYTYNHPKYDNKIIVNEDGTWELQLDNLSQGRSYDVIFGANDKAHNKTNNTNESAIRINYVGGSRVASTSTTTVETIPPAPLPVTPVEQPVVTEPTVVNVPTPTPTPQPATGTTVTETPEEPSPITGDVAVANPEESSGTTGFLGLSTGASKSVAITIGVLLIIGAIGYFVLFYNK